MTRHLIATLLLLAACPRLPAQESAPAGPSEALEVRCHEVRAALNSLHATNRPPPTPGDTPGAGQAGHGRGSVEEPARIQARLRELGTILAPFHADVSALSGGSGPSKLSPDARAALAALLLPIVERWIDLAAPRNRPSDLCASYPGFAALLAAHAAPRERRRFLNRIAERGSATRGGNDLDLLCRVVEWDALFLRGLAAGPRQLRALSADLILLFTERGPDGIRLSGAGLHREGRTRDRGFRAPLRDGSDQVRHFCWALRMFATSPAPALTERLLGAREFEDAGLRRGAGNASDLRLNRAARQIVADILGAARSEPAGTTPPPPTPLTIADYAELFRRRLGPVAPKKR